MTKATITMTNDAARLVFGRLPLFAATDDTRPVLTGVQINVAVDEGKARVVGAAADGFHLGVQSVPCELEGNAPSALIPAAVLKRIAGMLPRRFMPDEKVQIEIAGDEFTVRFWDREGQPLAMSGKCIVGTFPNYNNLIPEWKSDGSMGAVAVSPALQQTVIRAAGIGQEAPILRWHISGPTQPVVCFVKHSDYPPFIAVVMPMYVVGSEREELDEGFRTSIGSVVVSETPSLPEAAKKPRRSRKAAA